MDMILKRPCANNQSNLPPLGGVGLKPVHYSELIDTITRSARPAWVEIHPQNYFGDGGPPHRWLTAIADIYPLSFHSVGLSLGSADGLNTDDLERLAKLCDRYNPAVISDHLSFSGDAHHRFADLLPVPYTQECLQCFADAVSKVQDRLRRTILIENPARYLGYAGDEMSETEFIRQLLSKSGCGLLLDLNNVEVASTNLGYCAAGYVDAIDPEWVGEIHLAGHSVEIHQSGPLLIDDHGSCISDATWDLYRRFIARSGSKPTLVEWDSDVPALSVLMREMVKAQAIMHSETHAIAV